MGKIINNKPITTDEFLSFYDDLEFDKCTIKHDELMDILANKSVPDSRKCLKSFFLSDIDSKVLESEYLMCVIDSNSQIKMYCCPAEFLVVYELFITLKANKEIFENMNELEKELMFKGLENAMHISFDLCRELFTDEISKGLKVSLDFDPEKIVFDNKSEAEVIRERLSNRISKYGSVSVADLYEILGISNFDHRYYSYGWTCETRIAFAPIIPRHNGWYIKLPTPTLID